MNWLVLIATATAVPVDPATCARIGQIVSQVVQAETQAPAALRLKCEPHPNPNAPIFIPESVLPRAPLPRPLRPPVEE